MTEPVRQRDLVCIGASAGGVTAIGDLLAALPAELRATVFVVIHTPPSGPNLLAEILDRRTGLQVRRARDGDSIVPGTVYLAPVDHHLLVLPDRVGLGRGPAENRHRPSVDALFRSAAVSHSSRVIGVVLTGNLDDGAAGLAHIKRCGGVAVVQDPDDAPYPGMPQSAIEAARPQAILPLNDIAPLLRRLVGEPVSPHAPPAPGPASEVTVAMSRSPGVERSERLGELVPLGCPECGGPLWQIDDEDFLRYRCHIGHAFGARSLADQQTDEINRTLSMALRLFEERSQMLRTMATEQTARGHELIAVSYAERAGEADSHAVVLRQLLEKVPEE